MLIAETPKMTPSPVDQDELDLPVGLQSVWAITFSVLYLVVITASILMYLAVVRTMAVLGARGENVTTFLVMFLGFSTLVECALVVEVNFNNIWHLPLHNP